MGRTAMFLGLFACCWCPAIADDVIHDVFPLRNNNFFLQVYGLPAFQPARLAAPGRFEFGLGYDVANDADDAQRVREELIIDGESATLSVSLRRGVGERFEIGIDVPYVRFSGGYLDGVIYDFHDLIGLSNSSREGPSGQFRLLFSRDGEILRDTNTPASGLGDVQLSAAVKTAAVTLRAGIKVPTGDAGKLTGSGATDVSLGIYRDGVTRLFDRDLTYTGFLGVLALGDGEVLPELQRSAVPYGGAALRWHATKRLALAMQLYLQGPYFDIDLDELGGNTFQLAFGGDYRFPRQGLIVRLAIMEDIAAAATPDFALHLSIRRY